MKYLLNILLVLVGGSGLWAQGPTWTAANEAYRRQSYEEAASLYDSLIRMGYEEAELYYNAGNAHYKLDHMGSAILNYERALRLNPGDENVLHNLKLANARTIDKLERQPELFLGKWLKEGYRSRNSESWGVLGLSLIWIAFLFGALFVFVKGRGLKQLSFFAGVLALVLSLAAAGLSVSRGTDEADNREAIVMTPAAYVKEAPNGQTNLLILHEGSKVEVLDEIEGWRKVRIKAISTGEVEGFVRSEQVTKI